MSMWSYNRFEARKKYNNKFSKAYKEFMLSFDMWYDEYIRWPYTYITSVFWKKLSRALAFFKFGWNNKDWDCGFLHELVLFKLKRMQYEFIYHGHHSEDCENYKPKMKSLALAIKLLDRYTSPGNKYYTKYIDKHDEKWGKLEFKDYPSEVDKDGYVRSYGIFMDRKNVLTEEDKEQQRLEFLAAYESDEFRRERDLRIVYQIITKYHQYWWD